MNLVYGLTLHEFSVAQVDRTPARCWGCDRLESCWGLTFFLCPTLVTCWLFHFHIWRVCSTVTMNLLPVWGGSIPQSHLLFLNLSQLKIFLTTLMLLILCKNGLQKQSWYIILQWNLVNMVTSGPKEFGCINGVVILTRVFARSPKNSGRNNEVTVLLRWP